MEDTYKVVINGNGGVGKTSILVRYVDDTFNESEKAYVTIGADCKSKVLSNFNSKGKEIKLTIFDTAGHERFRNITSSFYRGALGAVLVYDINSRESFDEMQPWIDDVQRYIPDSARMVIGNKSDVDSEDRKVEEAEGKELANKINAEFFETSAKTGKNIEEAFLALASAMVKTKEKEEEELANKNESTEEKKSGCRCSVS